MPRDQGKVILRDILYRSPRRVAWQWREGPEGAGNRHFGAIKGREGRSPCKGRDNALTPKHHLAKEEGHGIFSTQRASGER